MTYRTGGSGPLLVLIHGITNSSASWEPVLAPLGRALHRARARPARPRRLGQAARRLLARRLRVADARPMLALGHDRGTFVGHSLGGGIAMQMGYQFPERVRAPRARLERRARPRGHASFLRAVALPGAELRCRSSAPSRSSTRARRSAAGSSRVGLGIGADLGAYSQGIATLADIEARSAFVHTARGMIDLGGQRIDARDKLYLRRRADADRVGRPRSRSSPPPRGPRARGDARQPAGDRRRRRPLPASPRSGGFAASVLLFVESTKPAKADIEPLRQLLVEHATASP